MSWSAFWRVLVLVASVVGCAPVMAGELPAQLQSAVDKVEQGVGTPQEEQVLRRYTNDKDVDVRLSSRVAMSRLLRERGRSREALAWVEEYATPSPETLVWPNIQGLLEAARVRANLGQTFEALSLLNRALKDSEGGLARVGVLRTLSELAERQPDLEKALALEKDALAKGREWFKRERVEETDSKALKPAKPGAGEWEVLRPLVEKRIADLERRIRVDRYGLEFVLYETAQILRKADHPSALDFTRIPAAFKLKDSSGLSEIPEADFQAARDQYLEIVTLFPSGVYKDASRLFAAVCLAHLGESRKAIAELLAFHRDDPVGLYRGEALARVGDLYLFAEGDRNNAKEAYTRAARWCEAVAHQTRVLETYLVPEKSRDITAPPKILRRLDRDQVMVQEKIPVQALVNRVTAPWYLKALRSEVEWKLAFLAIVGGDAAAARQHMDLALAHDPSMQQQVDKGAYNAHARILHTLERGKPLLGEAVELEGLNERVRLVMQWADMQLMLERFEAARELYRRIRVAAGLAGNGNAVARAAVAESHLLHAVDDPKRRATIPHLLEIAQQYPDAPSAPHLLFRAALLSHGEPLPSSELFAMIYVQYPQSPYAIRARSEFIVRDIPWRDPARRREEIDRFKRDYPERKEYHDYLERFDAQIREVLSRE